MTFLVIILFLAFFGVRTNKLVSATDPFFSMMTMAKEEVDPIDLGSNHFTFAIEDVDPKVCQVVVTHTHWGPGKNRQEASGKLYQDKDVTSIEMVDCLSKL